MPLSVMGQFEGHYDGTKGEHSLTSEGQSIRRNNFDTNYIGKKYQEVHHMVSIYLTCCNEHHPA